jgi:hypothetical protein
MKPFQPWQLSIPWPSHYTLRHPTHIRFILNYKPHTISPQLLPMHDRHTTNSSSLPPPSHPTLNAAHATPAPAQFIFENSKHPIRCPIFNTGVPPHFSRCVAQSPQACCFPRPHGTYNPDPPLHRLCGLLVVPKPVPTPSSPLPPTPASHLVNATHVHLRSSSGSLSIHTP